MTPPTFFIEASSLKRLPLAILGGSDYNCSAALLLVYILGRFSLISHSARSRPSQGHGPEAKGCSC